MLRSPTLYVSGVAICRTPEPELAAAVAAGATTGGVGGASGVGSKCHNKCHNKSGRSSSLTVAAENRLPFEEMKMLRRHFSRSAGPLNAVSFADQMMGLMKRRQMRRSTMPAALSFAGILTNLYGSCRNVLQ